MEAKSEDYLFVLITIITIQVWFTEIPAEYPYHCKTCGNEMCLMTQVFKRNYVHCIGL